MYLVLDELMEVPAAVKSLATGVRAQLAACWLEKPASKTEVAYACGDGD